MGKLLKILIRSLKFARTVLNTRLEFRFILLSRRYITCGTKPFDDIILLIENWNCTRKSPPDRSIRLNNPMLKLKSLLQLDCFRNCKRYSLSFFWHDILLYPVAYRLSRVA